MKGSNLLFLIGIVMCIIGGLATVSWVVILAAGLARGFLGIYQIIGQTLYIYVGQSGIKASRTGEGAERCVLFGKILLGFQIAMVLLFWLILRQPINWWATAISFPITLLYLYGAIQLEREKNV